MRHFTQIALSATFLVVAAAAQADVSSVGITYQCPTHVFANYMGTFNFSPTNPAPNVNLLESGGSIGVSSGTFMVLSKVVNQHHY